MNRVGCRLLAGLLGLCLLAPGSACNRTKLEQVPPEPIGDRDDKVRVDGEFCTSPPGQLGFPVRVLFIVDSSDSMEVTDPVDPETGEASRMGAVRNAWTKLLDEGEDVKIGITRFAAEASSGTTTATEDGVTLSYFSNDRDQLERATQALSITQRTTNYINALDEAYYELRTEMLSTDGETLTRARFAVIFLSDGLPDDGGGTARMRQDEVIFESVQRLRDLASLFNIAEMKFHTVYLSSDLGAASDAAAQALLGGMADAGKGTYRSVPNGEQLDFLHINVNSIKRVYSLTSFVAFNQQMVRDKRQIPDIPIDWIDADGYKDLDLDGEMECPEPLIDTDGDGLADLVELRIGTDPLDRDTDHDGLNDHIEWGLAESGLDPLDDTDAGCFVGAFDNGADPECVDADEDDYCDCAKDVDGHCIYPDTDGDGLHDCEEIYVGTSQTAVDTDVDGIPDPIEFRFGTNVVVADIAGDLDWDRTPNGIELRTGGDPQCNDAIQRSRMAYDYVLKESGTNGDQTCYRFSVSRMTLMPTDLDPAARGLGGGRNRILFFAGEQAFDEPQAYAGWRIACVEATYDANGDIKDPPSGRIRVEDVDFVPSEDFDLSHCR